MQELCNIQHCFQIHHFYHITRFTYTGYVSAVNHFHCCNTIPEKINFKGGRADCGTGFQTFQSMVSWLCWLGAYGKAEHPGGGAW